MSRILSRPWAAWGAVLSIAVLYALNAGAAVWQGASFTPFNGHFQNFWPLHRMSAGETPFVDFPVYLGAAQLYLSWPLFHLLGGDFNASSVSHDAIAAFLMVVTIVVAARLPGMRWSTVAILGIGLSAPFEIVAYGSNSALGIRSAAPFVGALLVWWACRGEASIRRSLLAAGAAGGLVVWSADYGIPSAIATVVALLLVHRSIVASVAVPVVTLAGILVTASLVSWGHPLEWIRSALLEPGEMQGWYFNPDPAKKTYDLIDLPWWDLPLLGSIGLCAFAAWTLVRGGSLPRLDRARSAALLALVLAAAGGFVLSCLAGTYGTRYAIPMWRTNLPAVLVAIGWIGGPLWRRIRGVPVPSGFPACCAVLFSLATWWLLPPTFLRDPETVALHRSVDAEIVPELGNRQWPEVVQAADLGRRLGKEWDERGIPASNRLHSLYGSVLSLVSRSRQPGPDYVIHALSDAAQARFADPVMTGSVQAVETLDPALVSWASWNIRMTWPLYRELFSSWTPTDRTAWSLVWRHGAPARGPLPDQACRIDTDGPDPVLRIVGTGISEPWWGDVEVVLDTSFEASWQPFVGRTSLLRIIETTPEAQGVEGMDAPASRGAWTARLRSGRIAFPVHVLPSAPTTLRLTSFPVERSSVSVLSCRVRPIRPVAETMIVEREIPQRLELHRSRAILDIRGDDGRAAMLLLSQNPYQTSMLRLGTRLRIEGSSDEMVVIWRDFRMVVVQHATPGGDIDAIVPRGIFSVLSTPSPAPFTRPDAVSRGAPGRSDPSVRSP